MSNMGNLEKLGILVIVILVVVVGVVAITPTDNAVDALGIDVARPAGEAAPLDPLDPLAGDVTDGAFPSPGATPGGAADGAGAGGAPVWPVAPGTAGAKPGVQPSADIGPDGSIPAPTPPVLATTATYKEVKVGKNETLAIIAKRELGSPTRWPEIVALNPGLDPKRMGTGITIRVPLRDGVAAAPSVPPAVPAAPGALSQTPPVDGTVAPAPKADTPAPVAEKVYVVQSGDTLSGISRRHLGSASRVGDLKAANADVLKGSDVIRSGMKLRIPGATASATRGSAAPAGTPSVVPDASGATVYTVQSGDTLSSIASRFLGSSGRFREIIAANEPVLHGSDKLKIGMKLTIPANVSAR